MQFNGCGNVRGPNALLMVNNDFRERILIIFFLDLFFFNV